MNIQNPFDAIDLRLKSIEEKLIAIASKELPETEKQFYHVSEAAKKLGVSPITIYRGVQAGKIPSKKIGSRVMVPGSYVDR